jgi:hypothetical protein
MKSDHSDVIVQPRKGNLPKLRPFSCQSPVQTEKSRGSRNMSQRSVVLHLATMGLSAVAIHDDLVDTLGAKVANCPSVTRRFREARLATSNPRATCPELNSGPGDCDEAILRAGLWRLRHSRDCRAQVSFDSQLHNILMLTAWWDTVYLSNVKFGCCATAIRTVEGKGRSANVRRFGSDRS